MRNFRQTLFWLTVLFGLGMASLLSSCAGSYTHGAITNANPVVETTLDGFSLRVWDESFPHNERSGSFSLEVVAQGTRRTVSIQATQLQGLKALYASIEYNHREYFPQDVSFTEALGIQTDQLQLHKLHRPGELQLGQVLIHPASKAGLSGNAVLAQVTFEQGSADAPVAVKSGAASVGGGAAVIWSRSVEPNVRWAFGGVADYDQNGEVNIADLTPIALNYGNTGPFDPLSTGHIVDGDGNGEVNLADITPIVLHYNEVTEGYDLFLRRVGESIPASRQASFATDPLASFLLDDGQLVDGVIQFSVDMLSYSGKPYDGELISVDVAEGIFSVLLGGEHALVEVVPQTNPPGIRPSVFIGGDPSGIPQIAWETNVTGSGTNTDPFRVTGDTTYNFKLLDLSAQDVSESFTNSATVMPDESSLFDSAIFSKVIVTSGDWLWSLEVGSISSLSQSVPTRMIAQFSPVTPGEGTAFEAWIVYDPINTGADFPVADFSITPNPAPVNWPIRLDASASIIPGSLVSDYSWDIEELVVDDIADESEINSDKAISVLWLSKEGNHNIRLAISDEAIPVGGKGKSAVDQACHVFEAPFGSTLPIAVASATPELVEPSEQAVLIGTDSNHPAAVLGLEIVDYYWDLTGQGTSGTATIDDPYSNVSSVSFSADAQGTFTFRLRVLDNVGSVASATTGVDVETIILPPIAAFSASPNPVIVDNQVSFDASASLHNDPLRSIIEYRWDFDGDGLDDLTSGTPDALHTFTEIGEYQVRLTVADDAAPALEAVNSTAVQVDPIPNDPPSAMLVIDTSPTRVNREVTLDASGSTDSDGTIVLYEFDVNGSGTYEYSGVESIIQHTFVAPFDLWVTVRVTDDGGATKQGSSAMRVLEEASWQIVELDDGDTVNDVGKYADLAIIDGFPAVAYYDVTDQDLKYVRAKNARGADLWRSSDVVAATPGVDDGLYPVLFQVGSNNPVIAYQDATNGNLMGVQANDIEGLSWGAPFVIDGSPYIAGQGLAGVIGSNRASLSYYDTTSNKLRFIQAANEAGTTWGTPVDVATAAGPFGADSESTISLTVDSMPCITAQLDGNATLHVATAADGTLWNPLVTIQGSTGPSAVAGFLPPVAYGAYYDMGAGELWFEIATQSDGSVWSEIPSTIGALADAGELVMLGPDQTQGLLFDSYIKYFVCVGSPTDGLNAFTTEDSQGTTWSSAGVVDAGVGAGAAGLSMLVADERPAIAWWDQANGHLMYAYYE